MGKKHSVLTYKLIGLISVSRASNINFYNEFKINLYKTKTIWAVEYRISVFPEEDIITRNQFKSMCMISITQCHFWQNILFHFVLALFSLIVIMQQSWCDARHNNALAHLLLNTCLYNSLWSLESII
jgi:hypothetical protein